ncbi:PQQ-dependent sugar dehydrogenase [Aggregatilinea lenta]|uniref:PQQ-dependent sugar dehydrogenase n=1 Tax=Aggregatilinea lenta TaxID=913108 RepID=UPI000E5BC956|nr:PQQ-dependent sugar dehydrogenase [Aggregatilinea lenta]
MRKFIIVGLTLMLAAAGWRFAPAQPPSGVAQQQDPPCAYVLLPYRNANTTCIELVYDDVPPDRAVPELGALAIAPDGTLYVLNVAHGEVWSMRDTDGDRFMEPAERVTGGLRLPTGAAYYDGALYVVDLDGIARVDDLDGDATVTRLVDGWAIDTGLWTGGIGVGPDERLYVSTGAPCGACADVAEGRGALISYALDGSDRRVEATGLRAPADFAWNPATGDLWILDQSRAVIAGESARPPDELNRFEAGADYGYPFCYGGQQIDPVLAPPSGIDCSQTDGPADLFPYQSSPSGAAFYTGAAFPGWQGDLLVAFNGSWNLPEPAGYAVVALAFADGLPRGTFDYLAPASDDPDTFSLTQTSLMGRGFYPFHPVDVAVDGQGWIYVSVQEGRIYRIRPRVVVR